MKLNLAATLLLVLSTLVLAACGGGSTYQDLASTELPPVTEGTLPEQVVANPVGESPTNNNHRPEISMGAEIVKGNQFAGLLSIGPPTKSVKGMRISGALTIKSTF